MKETYRSKSDAKANSGPLSGLTVIDFSTLLPGPMASLVLAEAGAQVIKVERPGRGDDMRHYEPKIASEGAIFSLLNRGKTSVAIDLKNAEGRRQALHLVSEADILLEQFRPGVMDRLGLGYEAVKLANPRLVYCSITGYGQHGPKMKEAGHDLNYLAESGFLSLVSDEAGAPTMPPVPLADIGGGTYPALINILMALIERARTGHGRHLDIAMRDNIYPFLYWALAGVHAGSPPRKNRELITGGSARYNIYRTRDDRFIAAAPLEEQFWAAFCDTTGLSADADVTQVRDCIVQKSAAEWTAIFAGRDVCCSVVATVEEAVGDAQSRARALFSRRVDVDGVEIPALPLPLVSAYRDPTSVGRAPGLPTEEGR